MVENVNIGEFALNCLPMCRWTEQKQQLKGQPLLVIMDIALFLKLGTLSFWGLGTAPYPIGRKQGKEAHPSF